MVFGSGMGSAGIERNVGFRFIVDFRENLAFVFPFVVILVA